MSAEDASAGGARRGADPEPRRATTVHADPGSFRDPSGRIHRLGDRIFRTVMPCAAEDFDFVRSTGLIDRLIGDGKVIAETVVDSDVLDGTAAAARYVLEHPLLPFISYPYEWPFAALKAAALHHLDVHLDALEHGVTLSDASAYNIQFRGAEPVFIDSLSFRRYRAGEFWMAHRQFCEQFLNPLLLRALTGIAHNGWYRGEMEGISAQSLSRVLPAWCKLRPGVLTHVVLQSRFQAGEDTTRSAQRVVRQRKLPLVAFKRILTGLRAWIARLQPRGASTTWQDYAGDNSYSDDESRDKRAFVADFARTMPGGALWDLGCNTGEYASVALAAGVGRVVGFDFDQGALDVAHERAARDRLDFQPLFMDAANPTPAQGWAQGERQGLTQRTNADALLALALVHHLAIARNVPIEDVIRWLVSLAPTGVIEFVQRADPMVQRLLLLRDDAFDDYTEDAFVRALREHGEIVRSATVSASGRRLYWYRRHGAARPGPAEEAGR